MKGSKIFQSLKNIKLSKSRTKELNQEKNMICAYKFGKTIGKGTFGKVVQATHLSTGENVAIKILEKSKIIQK